MLPSLINNPKHTNNDHWRGTQGVPGLMTLRWLIFCIGSLRFCGMGNNLYEVVELENMKNKALKTHLPEVELACTYSLGLQHLIVIRQHNQHYHLKHMNNPKESSMSCKILVWMNNEHRSINVKMNTHPTVANSPSPYWKTNLQWKWCLQWDLHQVHASDNRMVNG